MLDRSRRRAHPLWSAATVIAAVLVMVFVSGSPAGAQTTMPLYVGTSLDPGNSQVFFAQELGYFKQAGLNVEIQIMANGSAIAAAVAAGSVQVGAGNVITIANAHERGLPLTFIAGGGLYTTAYPSMLLVVAPNSAIRSAKDLDGKVVAGVNLGGLADVAVRELIDQNGGDSKSIKFVELPSSEMVAALERGTIGAALLVEPALGAANGKVRVLGKPYDYIAKQFMAGAFFASTDWVTKNSTAAKSFADAMAKSAQWANANPEKAAVIREKFTKLKPDPAHPLVIKYSQSLDPAMFQPIIDAGVKYKVIPRDLPASEIIWVK